jgi:hypothetical protein
MVRDRIPFAATSEGHSSTMSLGIRAAAGEGRRPYPSTPRLHDLPIRIFLNDLAISEFQKVTPSNLYLFPVFGGARQSPLRYAVIARNPVSIISVVNIRDAFKSCC